jgi:hypothetical protein
VSLVFLVVPSLSLGSVPLILGVLASWRFLWFSASFALFASLRFVPRLHELERRCAAVIREATPANCGTMCFLRERMPASRMACSSSS